MLYPRSQTTYQKMIDELKLSNEVQMTDKYFVKHSTFFSDRGMKIKTTFKFHLTLVRMSTIKKMNDNKC